MRTAVVLFVVLAFAVPAAQASETSPQRLRQAVRLTTKADKALEGGDLARARGLYAKALEAAPAWPDAHVGLGHIAMREHRFEEALADFEAARDGYAEMGDALFKQHVHRYNEAQDEIARLRVTLSNLRMQAGSRPNQTGDARLESQIARLEARIQQLENVAPPLDAETPEVPARIFFFIGNALGRLDRVEEAVAAWETCAGKDEAFAPVYNNLAVAYWERGRLDEAVASLERAKRLGLEVNPDLERDLRRAAASE